MHDCKAFATLISALILASGCDTQSNASKVEVAQRKLLKPHCDGDTFERVHETVEGVRGIVRVDDRTPGRYFVGGVHHGTMHPHYMLGGMGLEFIEFELYPEEREKRKAQFGRFDLRTQNYSYIDKLSVSLIVKFDHAGSIDEEKLGVLGRRITVYDATTGKIYGEQQEWFGRIVGGCREPQKQWRGHESLLFKVINPKTYRCRSSEVLGTSKDSKVRLESFEACEKAYWKR